MPAKHQTSMKIAKFLHEKTAQELLHCNHILFGPSVTAPWKIRRIEKGFGPLSLRKMTKFFIRRLQKRYLHCNHILFTLSVNNFLPAKHQTLLNIAYPLTQTTSGHCTVEYLEKHLLLKNASGLYP